MTKKLAEVYESGVAVAESMAEEQARLTAEVADLERQYEPVRTVQFPVLSAPGTSYGPLKRKLGLKIEIAERRARLSEIALAEAQAHAARVKAETVEADVSAKIEAKKQEIAALHEQLAEAQQQKRKLESRRHSHGEAIQSADRTVMRAAGEVEHWQGQIPDARRELADAEEIEAIKRANSAEERDRQRLLAG